MYWLFYNDDECSWKHDVDENDNKQWWVASFAREWIGFEVSATSLLYISRGMQMYVTFGEIDIRGEQLTRTKFAYWWKLILINARLAALMADFHPKLG